ncbi:MAG: hypothetical protein JXA77_00665 [Bacteroidales bacterium]|nr:hypothetical protein [Bacteroidales bacterium]MBN2820820.1 hypothetical protein [Bacteroidales bacterium]
MRLKLLNCFILIPLAFQVHGISDNPAFLSLPKGLPSNSVTSIIQDKQGFMWLGTFTGLSKYDGYNYETFEYNLLDINTITNSRINDLEIGPNGKIYIGTYGGGVNIYNPETRKFSYIYLGQGADDLASNNITKILLTSKGKIYAGTENGLYQILSDTSRFIELKPVKNLIVSSLAEDNEGNIWIGTFNHGLFRILKNTDNETEPVSIPGKSKNIRTLSTDYNGNIWLSYYENGFSELILENGEIKSFVHSSNFPIFKKIDFLPIQTIFCNSNGEIWLGSENHGLAVIEPGNSYCHHFLKADEDPFSIPDNSIWTIFKDNSGIFWLGTYGHGACRIDPFWNKFGQYNTENYFINNKLGRSTVTSFCMTDNESMLISTDGEGLFLYNKNEIKHIGIEPLNQMEVRAFEDEYWVSSWSGGIKIVDKDLKVKSQIFGNTSVFRVIEDRFNNKWITTWGNGVYKFSPENKISKTFSSFDEENTIISSNIFTIFEDSESRIWIGTLNGLCVLSNTGNNSHKIENFISNPADSSTLTSNIVLSIFQDSDENIWIGTSNGLNKYIPGENNFKRIHNFMPGKSFEIRSILEGSNHNLWLGTNKGLIRFNIYSENSRIYEESDGLPFMEFRINAAHRINDDKLIFGGNGGVVMFDPKRIEENPRPPNTIITDIRLFNKEVNIGERPIPDKALSFMNSIKLSPKMNVFTLEFTAINYTRPENNSFEYMLEGLESSWNAVGNQRNATYSNLDPGEYTFKVRSTNNDGVYDETPATLKIIVTPPFYKTWFFRILVILAIGLLIYIGVSFRMNELHRRVALNENLAKLEKWKRMQIEIEQERQHLGSQLDEKTHELAEINLQVAQKNEKLFTVHQQILDILPNASRENYKKLVQLRRSLEEDINQKENWKALETGINLTHDNFLQRFTEKYPKITHKDLKLVAYIRMNLSNKEIANLLNITLRSVESGRYRLRKRLDILKDINLNDFIMRF